MARLWQLGVQPVRPGTYFRVSSGDVTTEGAINGIVAVVHSSNWGVLNEVVDISPEDLNNLTEIVGTGKGYEVIRQALIGGAFMVRAVRVGTGGTHAYKNLYSPRVTKEVTDEEGNKSTVVETFKVVRIHAKYNGNRPFYTSVKKNLLTGLKQCDLYDNQMRLIDSVSFTAGGDEATKLVKAINAGANFFFARRVVKGKYTLRDYTQSTPTNSGTNPTTNIAAYNQGTEILERYSWNCIIADSNSQSVHDVLISFVRQSYQVGHLGMAVIAGVSSNTLADRMAFAAATNDWRVVYVLSGWRGVDQKTYGGYLAAARIAGMIAACETNASCTHLVVQDALKPVENLTNGQIIAAEEKGCFVLSINDDDQVWIDNAINTLITLGNDQDEGWKKIRRTKCRFELMSRVNRTCDKLVGRLNNDANGRATIISAMQSIINEMIGEGKLFLGSYAAENPVYKPVGDRAYFMLVIGDIDSMEKIFLDYNFSYANPFSELDTVSTT